MNMLFRRAAGRVSNRMRGKPGLIDSRLAAGPRESDMSTKIDLTTMSSGALLEMMKSHSKDAGIVKRMTSLRMLWDIEARVAMLGQWPELKAGADLVAAGAGAGRRAGTLARAGA